MNGSINISGTGNLYLKNIYVNGTPLIDTVSGWEGNYTTIIADISSRMLNSTVTGLTDWLNSSIISIGNWSRDTGYYYNKTEINAQQTSINSTITSLGNWSTYQTSILANLTAIWNNLTIVGNNISWLNTTKLQNNTNVNLTSLYVTGNITREGATYTANSTCAIIKGATSTLVVC